MATNVLIIEDEPIIAMELEAMLLSVGHKVTGVARTEGEALRLASAKQPGLVLADIQLATEAPASMRQQAAQELSGAGDIHHRIPERLLTGERPEPVFLITKPFMPEMVKAVVSQALFFETKPRAAA